MSISRRIFAGALGPIFSVALAASLGGCGSIGNSDSMSSLMVAPNKYNLYRCDQLAVSGQEAVSRAKQLRMLMEKSAQGPGGAVVNALAYENEYLTRIGELKLLDRVALEKKCDTPWRSDSDKSLY